MCSWGQTATTNRSCSHVRDACLFPKWWTMLETVTLRESRPARTTDNMVEHQLALVAPVTGLYVCTSVQPVDLCCLGLLTDAPNVQPCNAPQGMSRTKLGVQAREDHASPSRFFRMSHAACYVLLSVRQSRRFPPLHRSFSPEVLNPALLTLDTKQLRTQASARPVRLGTSIRLSQRVVSCSRGTLIARERQPPWVPPHSPQTRWGNPAGVQQPRRRRACTWTKPGNIIGHHQLLSPPAEERSHS